MPTRTLNYVVGATLALLMSPVAFAHAHPKVMDPAPDTTVSAPKHVSIEFSEALDPKFSSLHLASESGKAIDKTPSAVSADDPKHMTLNLPALSPGVYVVHWVSVATDGHRLEGSYKFTVK